MTSPTANLSRLAWAAVILTLGVIVFGAFVRLSNAGLSCPDWPTCYGRLTWPTHEHEIASANLAYPDRPVESAKAWREQVHRFLAGGLILTTFSIAALAWRARRRPGMPVRVPLFASGLIVFQALLGMWTVTWKLKPIVVMAHLLGGMATLALLVWTAVRLSRLHADERRGFPIATAASSPADSGLARMTVVALVLVSLQIALGGWTSANYAAMSCGTDFPTCLGQWWPATDFREAFVLWRGIGVDYEGGVLDGPARVAIQLAHRLFALVVAGHLIGLSVRMLRMPEHRTGGMVLLVLLAVQVGLGIANVKLGLPLPVATAHNGVAALLLATLVALLARPQQPIRQRGTAEEL